MPVNKNAQVRYLILDDCLSNRNRKWTWKDLLQTINQKLQEEGQSPIGKTTLFEDLKDIEYRVYKADIEKLTGEKKTIYYQYADKTFSIRKQPLNQEEASQLRSAIQVLSRLKGMPQFEWVQELLPQLETRMGLDKESKDSIITFDMNAYYRGLEHITPLFHAIQYKRVLKITYQNFKSPAPYQRIFHPHHMKQHDNRWFVFGMDPSEKVLQVVNLALDRIKKIEETDLAYQESEIDWKEYFDDIIGVTRYKGDPVEVELLIRDEEQVAYIETKPLHHSQKPIVKSDKGFHTRIRVIPNMELVKLIMSFGSGLEVLAPEDLRKNIRDRVIRLGQYYAEA